MLITPRVVTNQQDARDITDEFRRKLKGLAPLIPASEPVPAADASSS